MKTKIHFTLNHQSVQLDVDPDRMLLWVLRTDLGLTGTKYGCGQSYCGACTVLIDQEPVRSCQTAIGEVQGREVVTIEGLAAGAHLHPLQEAFVANDALQCGFCTPGMILNAHALLRKNARPSRAEIIEGMEDNLCRCGSHTRIIRAIQEAAEVMERRA